MGGRRRCDRGLVDLLRRHGAELLTSACGCVHGRSEADQDLGGAHVTCRDEPTMWTSVEHVGKERDCVEVMIQKAIDRPWSMVMGRYKPLPVC